MMKSFNRPQAWATLFTIPALCLLIGLGIWQTHRLAWKEDLIRHRAQAMQQAPLLLNGKRFLHAGKDLDFRWVLAEGRFLPNAPVLIGPRTQSGRAGFHVLAVFQLKDGTNILVNRGFLPANGVKPVAWTDRLPMQALQITGILRDPHQKSWLTPKNQPDDRRFFWYDIPALEALFDVSLAPIVLDLFKPKPAGPYPVPGQTRIQLTNNHLQYAVTWFAFAVTLFIIYFIFMRRQARAKEDH